jgi:hypothetical protein
MSNVNIKLVLVASGVVLALIPFFYYAYRQKRKEEDELIFEIARKAEKNIRSFLKRHSPSDLDELEKEIEEISTHVLLMVPIFVHVLHT